MATPERCVGVVARQPCPSRGWLVTVLRAAAVGVGGVLTLGGTTARALSRGVGRMPLAVCVAAVLGALLLLALVGVATLTVLGGVMAMRRDRLEARGRPYPPRRRREWKPGPAVRAVHRGIRCAGAFFSGVPRGLALLPYDLIEVRSFEQILRTLDARGALDALPFMPEMAAFCGRRYRVFRRVEKIHEYVAHTGLHRMRDTVLLEGLRCGGEYHGGCQASCHLLWKEAWLKRAADNERPLTERAGRGLPGPPDAALRGGDLQRLVTRTEGDPDGPYVCQMTEVARASTRMSWNDPRHYLRDLFIGNVRPGPFLVGVSIEMFNRVQRRFGRGLVYPQVATTGLATSPHAVLDLQPGDMVRVRAKLEIERTLTVGHKNRGLWFDAEMLRFCGGEYRVSARVVRLIDAKSGAMITLGNPCVILEGVTATGEYLAFCPQNESVLWREIWLERSPSAVQN